VLGVLEGFATIGVVVALGYLLGHLGVLDAAAQLVLSRLAFYVASPALLLTVMARTPVRDVLSGNLLASVGSVVVTMAGYVLVARLLWHPSLGESVVGSLCAAYVNASNLGIPIALFVLGDISVVAPTLLLQLLVLQPLAIALLDSEARGRRPTPGTILLRTVRNPLTVGAFVGLLVSLFAVRLPPLVSRPLDLVGAMAVPAMLIAFGISLRLGPRPGADGSWPQVSTIVTLKLGLQPLAAVAVGYLLVGLRGHALFAAAVTGALPTAQNVFVLANRYNRGLLLARDSIFVSTFASVPVILLIAVLFKGVP